MKRSDFFRGMWLSPLALVRAPETPPNSPSTVETRREARRDVQRDAALATTRDVFDVKDYGARGDGTTDDTAAIRAAATAAIGGVLFFSPGTYLLTDQITIGDGASLSAKDEAMHGFNAGRIQPQRAAVIGSHGTFCGRNRDHLFAVTSVIHDP